MTAFLLRDSAPRIYLDSAVLIDLADGRVSSLVADKFLCAMTQHAAALVLTHGHLIDLYRETDDLTRERFAAFAARLPVVATPLESVDALERAAMAETCHEQRAPNPDFAVAVDVRAQWLNSIPEQSAMVSGLVTQAHQASSLAFDASGNPQLTAAATPIFERLVLAAIRDEAPADLLAMHRALQGDSMLDHLAGVLENWRQVSAALADMYRNGPALHGVAPEDFARLIARNVDSAVVDFEWFHMPGKHDAWRESARKRAPGSFLRDLLLRSRRQRGRAPQPGDSADEQHVLYAPYMDVVSVDRENYGVLSSRWETLHRPRSGLLVKNSQALTFVSGYLEARTR